MAAIHKTIALTEQQNSWINNLIAQGKFTDFNAYFNKLIQQDQEKTQQIKALRQALIEGEESGISPYSAEEILEATRARLGINA